MLTTCRQPVSPSDFQTGSPSTETSVARRRSTRKVGTKSPSPGAPAARAFSTCMSCTSARRVIQIAREPMARWMAATSSCDAGVPPKLSDCTWNAPSSSSPSFAPSETCAATLMLPKSAGSVPAAPARMRRTACVRPATSPA